MKKNSIDETLKKLKIKIWANKIIHGIVSSLFIVTVIVFVISIFSHITPIVDMFQRVIIVLITGITVGTIYGLINYPSIKETATIGDSLGFKERLSTYIELGQDEDGQWTVLCPEGKVGQRTVPCPTAKAFIEETENAIKREEPLKKYRIVVNGKRIIISIIILALSVGIFFIPSSNRDIASEREDIRENIKEEIEQIEELKEQIIEDDTIEEEKKSQIVKELDKLERKLSKTFDYSEGALHVAETQEKIDKIMGEAMNGGQSANEVFKGDNYESSQRNISNISGSDIEGNDGKEIKNNTKNRKGDSKTYDGEDIGSELQKVDVDLENMTDRLLSKENKGFESIGGKDKTESLTEGNTDNLDSGELSKNQGEDILGGGNGTQPRDSKDGVGGSGSGNSSSSFKRNGKIKRQDSTDNITKESSDVLNIDGKKGKSGDIKTVHSDSGIGVEGMDSVLENSYRKFVEDKLKYLEKYSIPEVHKSLVSTYFENLLEE